MSSSSIQKQIREIQENFQLWDMKSKTVEPCPRSRWTSAREADILENIRESSDSFISKSSKLFLSNQSNTQLQYGNSLSFNLDESK